MRLLLLTPSLPYPPHQGGALRNYGLLRGLSTAGHRITLLSFHDGSPPVECTPLIDLCEAVHTVPTPSRAGAQRLFDLIASGAPDLARRLRSSAFCAALTALLAEQTFDLVQLEGLEMAAWLPQICAAQPQARLCYDAHNAEYALQRAIYRVDRRTPRRWPLAAYSLIQWRRIQTFERDVCRQVNCVLAVSDEDAAALRPFRPDGCVHVIPNGIFISDYARANQRLDLGPNALVFTGKMDYRPNVDAMLWFTDAVLPQVQRAIPTARLYIVGQRPHPQIERLREKAGVFVTGWVDAVQPYLRAAAVYTAPLRMGSGTRLKILEAMAAGCAVVATSAAAAGLPAAVKSALVLADDASEMTDAIVTLLDDPPRRFQLGQAALAVVKSHFDWAILLPRLLAAYKECGIG
ncbi:MAG: glycosyltransferase [Aggregatilineales bacterium]